jgi:CheY-like chemotaxis protein
MTADTFDLLVIEDDLGTVEGTLSELDLRGYTFETVISRARAEECLASHRYALILVDLKIPYREDEEPDESGGLDLIMDLRAGRFGQLNQDKPYIIISTQEFRLDGLEQRISDPAALEAIRKGRVLRYQKGSMMAAIVGCVEDTLKGRVDMGALSE